MQAGRFGQQAINEALVWAGRRASSDMEVRRLLVIGSCLLAVLAGMRHAAQVNTVLLAYLQPLLMATFAAYWCVVDARMRTRPMIPAVHVVLFCLWPLAVPIYLIVSRRWRGIGLILVVCLAWVALTWLGVVLSRSML